MAITVSTVYALDMPKYVYLQLYTGQAGTVPQPIRIRADRIEKEDGGKMTFKIGNETVGEFATAVQGWWIQDEDA